MDGLVTLVWGVGSVAVAAVVAVVVGRRRGIDAVDARADAELRKLVDAQAARLAILEAENARQASELVSLRSRVAHLEDELRMERAITARVAADGR